MFWILVISVVLTFVARELYIIIRNERILKPLKIYEKDFKAALVEFKNTEKNWYISDWQYRQWKLKYLYLTKLINPKFLNIKTEDPFKIIISDFLSYFHNGRKLYIDQFNEDFVKNESQIIKSILDEKNIQNNDDQVNAIASDEDNTLLVAGAGTGKTTTILGKLAYLGDRVKILPKDILLLSFTGRAVKELNERIQQKFEGLSVKAQTFHSFGRWIISQATGKKPSLAFDHDADIKVFLNKTFNEQLQDDKYLRIAIEYFAYYFTPVILEPGFNSLNEYYRYVKTEENITLKKEFVKSRQEVMIANFLYLNGIAYEYEKPYEYETADKDYSQYKPDFFLSDYNIYIEHFGVNRKGETKFTNNSAQNKIHTAQYKESMKWKRELHSKYNTQLIETYSYEFTEKKWQEKLIEKLNKHKVKFQPRKAREVFESLSKDVDIKKIADLFNVFLGLSKSNGYSLQIIQSKINSRDVVRERVFFGLFKPIYEAYELHLKQTRTIDFNDMLIDATNFVNAGQVNLKFKYIIIDEFQDFSVSKYNLIKALCSQYSETKLFCVGDDWQSIFRFTGSDISLMTKFEESYGFTRKDQLVITNRFNDNLAVVSNKFILKNPNQLHKEVQSMKHEKDASVKILSKNRNNDIDHLLREVLSQLNNESGLEQKKSSVFILGRYQHTCPPLLEEYKNDYSNLTIDFLTVHSSKGSEADHVIIMDVISGRHGFPTEITDDPILEIVLSEDEFYPHAEERRLMYVAMTRARHKVYIMTEDGKESVFVLELKGYQSSSDSSIVRCDDCGSEMALRKGKFSNFYGCKNFPECRGKKRIV
jgi:DNA helicase-4